MATYHIEPERRTLHGHFSPDLPPVLTVESGDTVVFRTLESGWDLGPRDPAAPGAEPEIFAPRDPERDAGHALCGPVAVRGAEPGMTLEVRIDEVVAGDWGVTFAGGWPHEINERFGLTDGAGTILLWTIDRAAGVCRDQHGRTVALRPFLSVMGMPPAEPGIHPTPPPRATGGNLDCKELVAGSRLFLPVAVPGGLFSLGDGHAAQGDGEACVTAIECPMDRAAVTLILHPDLRLDAPRAETAEGWLTFGLHEDLNEAMLRALEAMVALMQERFSLARADTLALASLTVDLRVTQVVNGVKGVHAVLPHTAARGLTPAGV
jgi:acetamidase/formamidase